MTPSDLAILRACLDLVRHVARDPRKRAEHLVSGLERIVERERRKIQSEER